MPMRRLGLGVIVICVCIFSRNAVDIAKAGFTGPSVPVFETMRGDWDVSGSTLPNGRADIPRLVKTLQRVGATDFFQHIDIDNGETWTDFQLMAPAFQQSGIRLWAMLFPHGLSTPYGSDYVTWGRQIATVAAQYPVVSGFALDDFSSNTGTFTNSYLRSIMNAAHAIDPDLALLGVAYYDTRSRIASAVRNGVIDGVLFPYRIKQNETQYFQDTTQLAPQLATYRAFLDQQTQLGGLSGKMPLVTMSYVNTLSYASDSPTPEYVDTVLRIGDQNTNAGVTNGIMTYGLKKSEVAFLQAYKPAQPVALLFFEDFQSVAPSGDAFLDYPEFKATGDQTRTVDTSGVLRLGAGPAPAANFLTATPTGYTVGSELVIKIDMGFDGPAGQGGTALRLGENTIVFHPGYNGPPGAFRVEGSGGFGNSSMGWVPALNVLHQVEIHSFPSGLFNIKITDGSNPALIYMTSFTNRASYGGEIGPAAIGLASAMFDNFSIQAVMPGDFNHSGTVDAADYVLFRKGLGNIYTQTDYDVWRAHFGQTAGSGSGAGVNVAVPEPATLVILMIAAVGPCVWRRRQPIIAVEMLPHASECADCSEHLGP